MYSSIIIGLSFIILSILSTIGYWLLKKLDARFASLLSEEGLRSLSEKNKKKEIIVSRGERVVREFFLERRKNFFWVWGFIKRIIRLPYYWALQKVDTESPLDRGIVLLQKVHSNGALEDFQENERMLVVRALDNPRDAEAYLSLARLYAKEGKFDEVIELLAHVRKIARLYPEAIELQYPDAKEFGRILRNIEKSAALAETQIE